MTHPDPFFALPDRLAAKRDPALINGDARRFAAIAETLRRREGELRERLAAERLRAGGHGQAALERDLEVHRLSAELRTLGRYGVDLCLGRMVEAVSGEATYIGRLGLADAEGRRLLVDWRTPAAEPYFAATLAHPLGLASRRRYRWAAGRVSDYWDEAFGGGEGGAALDDQSAFIASLGASRSGRMRDVLGTIQADQDAIIRADARGALVVDGGPGTGKTVVALHRAAYLLHADPRVARGGVLVVGPHQSYLAYVADVLPSLGEESVRLCTPADLVAEGRDAGEEPDAEVAALKADGRMLDAVEALVAARELPPVEELEVDTDWGRLLVDEAVWDEALAAAEPGIAHNDARDLVWQALVEVLHDQLDDEVPLAELRRALAYDAKLSALVHRTWPVLDPLAAVAALWSDPRLLGRCAPWLGPEQLALLQRVEPRAWTAADLPIVDAARRRIGDSEALRVRRRRESERAAERERMDRVVEELVAAEQLGDGEGLGTMLRGTDVRTSLEDESALTALAPDELLGPFAHLVIDEAQELSDAQWRMLLARCPSGSVTVVGDRAQARGGFAETWQQRLRRAGLREVRVAPLHVNYRTPEEVMAVAAPVIRTALPAANVPESVRSSGVPVRHGRRDELDAVLEGWLAAHEDGTACVIGAPAPAHPRIRSLTPMTAKGLEFDLVVLVDPEALGDGIAGAVDRYVAMTRSTRELVILR